MEGPVLHRGDTSLDQGVDPTVLALLWIDFLGDRLTVGARTEVCMQVMSSCYCGGGGKRETDKAQDRGLLGATATNAGCIKFFKYDISFYKLHQQF